MKRKIAAGGITIIVLLFLVRIFILKPDTSSSQRKPGGGRGGPVAIQTGSVTWGALRERREFSGTVKAAYSYVVAAKVAGRLVSITKRIGDPVGMDETVGKIDATEYRHALEDAQAQVNIGKASVAEAEAQLRYQMREKDRVSELMKKDIASQAELDAIETQYASQASRLDLAKAQLAQKEIALAQAKTRFNYTSIKTAQPGYIAQRHTDGGELLSVNSPVVTVVGFDTVYVEIGVTERDYPKIKQGQKTEVYVEALPDRKFSGTIRHTAPSFQTSTRTARVEVAVKNDSLVLRPGMFARIIVTLAEYDSVQIVPVSSIVVRDRQSVVFMVTNGVAHQVAVNPGITDGNKAEIRSPLLQGDVVTMGQHLLTNKTPIINSDEKRQDTLLKRGGVR